MLRNFPTGMIHASCGTENKTKETAESDSDKDDLDINL